MASTLVDEKWTTNKLTEELYLDLMRARDDKGDRKYEIQAQELIYRIPVYKPIPRYLVWRDDLSYKVKRELSLLEDNRSFNKVMKEAISAIFENINEQYFLLSVKKLLMWEIV